MDKDVDRDKAPKGECKFCDELREQGVTFHPPHNPSPLCRNRRAGFPTHTHCTCAACF